MQIVKYFISIAGMFRCPVENEGPRGEMIYCFTDVDGQKKSKVQSISHMEQEQFP